MSQRTLVVDPEAGGQRLDRYLAHNLTHLSRSYLQKLIEDQLVLVGGSSARASYRVRPGDRVQVIEPPPRPAQPLPEEIPLDVVFEDSDLIVLNKPAGLVVHPAPGAQDGTLVNALLHHCDDLSGVGGVERPGIVHRLDRNTSGLLVVTKNDATHRHLAAQFHDHQVHKTYLAFAGHRSGPPLAHEGSCDTLYGRHPVHRKRFSSKVERGKRAVTHYRVVARYAPGGFTALKVQVELETGRTHQIRVHLSDAGHPILGDKLYGGHRIKGFPSALLPARQALHAWRLGLVHPGTQERMDFEAPLPKDLRELERMLKGLAS